VIGYVAAQRLAVQLPRARRRSALQNATDLAREAVNYNGKALGGNLLLFSMKIYCAEAIITLSAKNLSNGISFLTLSCELGVGMYRSFLSY